ncbi:hypothetical protein Y032_0006g3084 [Ancylostoma ceylanicum]|nr:hypothetical protein Y032_0006g3084 [Ancylostoma ceylanicum]
MTPSSVDPEEGETYHCVKTHQAHRCVKTHQAHRLCAPHVSAPDMGKNRYNSSQRQIWEQVKTDLKSASRAALSSMHLATNDHTDPASFPCEHRGGVAT